MQIYGNTICEHIREKYPELRWVGNDIVFLDDNIVIFFRRLSWTLYILGEEELYKEDYGNMKDCDLIDHIIECPYKAIINYKNQKMNDILDKL